LFLLSLIAIFVAVARPTAVITLPSQQQTVVLAIDVSLSMGAKDVDPNRLTAAQAAAKAFVEESSPATRIGIVAFEATASLCNPDPEPRSLPPRAVFQLQRGTATSALILLS
jgi:Ca-activated chloride channel family protein